MATETENGTIVGPGEQVPTGTGGSITFFPTPGSTSGDANTYPNIPNADPPPPPVTSVDYQRQVDNTINTAIQPVTPPAPPSSQQILNSTAPNPTEPPPVTPDQILGAGVPTPTPPPPVTSADFNANINQSNSSAPPDPSLNGDSNIAGGVATGTPNTSAAGGNSPGSGTVAGQAQNPGGNSPVDSTTQGPGGLNAWGDSYIPPVTYNYAGTNPPTPTSTAYNNSLNQGDTAGRRVRLRPKPAAANRVYGDPPILGPLMSRNGLVWPYQPLITYTQDVDYKSMDLTHSIQDIQSYHRTPSLKLTVDGEFTVQNQEEGLYAIACIHFLRTVTKMNFGSSDPLKGTPPPVLLFDAYGTYMFNALPVVVTGFTIGLPKEHDYVPIDLSNTGLLGVNTGSWADLTRDYLGARNTLEISWLPALFNIQVNLVVQNSPTRLRSFNLNQFRNGSLMKQGGWI
jgi:hypothetical protein